MTVLRLVSTLGTMRQRPARKSDANQVTMSETAERFVSVALSCASEPMKSGAPFAVWTFSGNQEPKPSED